MFPRHCVLWLTLTEHMQELTNAQRTYLRKLAHDLTPLVQLGKNGLTAEVQASIGQALDVHELIKVKFLDFRDEKRELTATIATDADATVIMIIGNIAILYREQPDALRRKIRLPFM